MKGQSTIGTYLYIGTESADTLFYIKQYPDLGGSPEQIEVTDCEDEQQMNVAGVQSMESIDFLMNFKQETFADLQELLDDGKADLHFELRFGEQGEHGLFTWTGCGVIRVNGGDVNSAREMTLTVFLSSEITDGTEVIYEMRMNPEEVHLDNTESADLVCETNIPGGITSDDVWFVRPMDSMGLDVALYPDPYGDPAKKSVRCISNTETVVTVGIEKAYDGQAYSCQCTIYLNS